MPRHCVRCGDVLTTRDVEGRTRLACAGCGAVHYENPKPCVGAVIVRGGEVLLARRAREPFQGWWDLPGGFMEVAETPEEALTRELAEELGVTPRHPALLGVWPGRYGEGHTLNLVYLVEVEGEPAAASDVAEVRWWPLDALPENLAFPHEQEALRVARARLTGDG